MPVRPGVDDHEGLNELVALWRSGSADLDTRIAAVWTDVRREVRRVGEGSHRAYRLGLQVERLQELRDVSEHVLDGLLQSTDQFIAGGAIQGIYSNGANVAGRTVGAFSFTAPHRAAAEVLATDTYQEVLAATRFVDADSKAWVRNVSRMLTGAKITGGEPVKAQARRFERELRREFTARGIGAVTYANGSRHSFGEYAEMLLRTKTGMAYNVGTLNHSVMAGVGHFEILDGSLCGLRAHNDTELANGMIVDAQTAQSWPLSHPNCRRAFAPRPDVTRDRGEGARSVVSDESRADQTAFEEALRAQARGRQDRPGGRRERRVRPRSSGRVTAAQRRKEAARAEAAAGNARRRARIEEARAAAARAQRQRLEGERIQAAGSGNPPDGVLERWGVTEDQWVNGRAVAATVKRDIRKAAAAEADELGVWLADNSLDKLARPERLRSTRDMVSGQARRVRDSAGFDFLEGLSEAELRRVRARMVDGDLFSPDLLGDQVRRVTNLDMSDDQAMDWLVDQWLREDGLRSVASGRLPKYANVDNLIPADYGLEGYRLADLFGVDIDEAAGHVAQIQAAAGREYAERVLGRPRFGQAPWEMDAGDYVRELAELDDLVGLATAEAPVAESVRLRLLELAPSDIDPTGEMAPMELFERIRITAQAAGYPVA